MRSNIHYKILDAVTANGVGNNIFALDYKLATLSLNTTGNTSATIKIQISQQEECPDFSAAQTATNKWSYVQVINTDNGVATDGSTGIILSGTDIPGNQYTLNVDGQKWVNAIVSSYSAGSINLDIDLYTNE